MIWIGILLSSSSGFSTSVAISDPNQTTGDSDFNFVAAGDWGCDSKAQDTLRNMQNKSPEVVLALGDLSFQKSADCWLDLIKPLESKLKIILGDHDIDESNLTRYNRYLDHFNMTNPFYSFDYKNVHFLAMATAKNKVVPYGINSEQYRFIMEDLKKAQSNEDIKWIIVYSFRPFYSSNSTHPGTDELQDIYHPIFDKYGVDIVLQAHNHNYQRTYPLKYNEQISSEPIIRDKDTREYKDPGGPIFITVGTAGRDLYNFTGQKPFVIEQFMRHGFLNVEFIDNGKNLTASFYENRQGKIKDHFTLLENRSGIN